MKIEVQIGEQPLEFIRRQAPETRRALRDALHEVERGKAFPEPLEDALEGFYKLRVTDCRLILRSVPGKSGPIFRVEFAERRSVVYELFKQLLGL